MRSIVLVLATTVTVVVYAGTCPKYPLIRNFDMRRYMGLWFQQDKLQASWEMPGRCWKTLYSRDRKNGMFKMKMIYSSTFTGRLEEYDSQLTLGSPKKPSMIKYSIPLTFMEDEFQVLATDYESFTIEYKCDPNGFLEKQESVFLMTREKNPSPLVLQRAYAIMHRLGVDIRKLERVDQTCGGLNLSGPEYPDYLGPEYPDYLGSEHPYLVPEHPDFDFYTNDVPDTRRHYQDAQNYDYSGPVEVEPSPPSNQQGWVPVQGSQSVQHNSYQHEALTASDAATGPQLVEMQPVDHQQQFHPQHIRQPDPKIMLRQGNRRNGGGNRRLQRPPADDRITLGQTLATKLWHVLHSPVRK